MRENLEKRLEILGYLARRAARGEGAPSVKEVGEAVGLRSTQTAHKHLKKLEEAGYVEREVGKARGLRLTPTGWEVAGRTPLLGRIAAGRGFEAIVDESTTFSLPAELLYSPSGRERYSLRVVGQSMTGAGIEDGDLLVVEEDEDPPDGAVVVALLRGGEEVTVKRLYREGKYLRLKPENGEHEDIVVPDEETIIQGRVVYVIHPPRRRH
ncbi:repressor LexA [Rubrobacter taiwanensis]|jgi:repressor LexA|uniref:Repressor LexA n=1 Tax=Rubrobacter taiwanensis TaxID=185139 RepID=A0A4V2NX08_9ACTN|nr:transcriptional repressor LexA [Rubrobacter taiwanensis]MCA3747835.1 repressor LexA [Rubrobacter sp.]TCJ19452.1 repressor LexA [Rubrobacter taiwanensis]